MNIVQNMFMNIKMFSTQVMTSLRGNSKKEIDIIVNHKDELPKERNIYRIPATRMASNHSIKVNHARRKVEDKMAKLFMWIVVVFMACHLPR